MLSFRWLPHRREQGRLPSWVRRSGPHGPMKLIDRARPNTAIARWRKPQSSLVLSRGHRHRTIWPLKESLAGPERNLIVRALRAFGGNRREAARALDVNRTTLYKKM